MELKNPEGILCFREDCLHHTSRNTCYISEIKLKVSRDGRIECGSFTKIE